jgi:hypothetical protein
MRLICMFVIAFIVALGLGLPMLSAVPSISLFRPLSWRTTRAVRYGPLMTNPPEVVGGFPWASVQLVEPSLRDYLG